MSLREAFLFQAESNAALGSPFTARVLTRLADLLQPGSHLTDRLHNWPADDKGPLGASLPLRVLGGLHALVLNGTDPDLAAVYPPNPEPGDKALDTVLSVALDKHTEFLNRWIDSAPQTNEVRRAAALIAAGHWLNARFRLPVALSELGASAGLNLMWDQFALRIQGSARAERFGPNTAALTLSPDWTGPCPPLSPPTVAARRGVDLNPLDPDDPDDALRLLAFLWADQPERLSRTHKAIAVANATVDQGDAAAWLEQRLAALRPGQLHLVYHTIAWQYFPQETQERCLAAFRKAPATTAAPLARLSMEADSNSTAGKGAALTLTLWPGEESINLGRIDFHGRWIDWQAPGLATPG